MGRRPATAKLPLLKGVGPGRDSGGRIVPTPPNFTRQAPENPGLALRCGTGRMGPHHTGSGGARPIKPEDRAALTVYVETWSTYCEAVALLRAEGLTLVNPDSGHTSAHPCAQIANNAGLLLLRFAGEFGLTPVAERRLGTITGTDDEHDPFNGG